MKQTMGKSFVSYKTYNACGGFYTSKKKTDCTFELRVVILISNLFFRWDVQLLISCLYRRSLRHPGNATPSERGGAESWRYGSRGDAGHGHSREPTERGGNLGAPGAVPSTRPQPAASTRA